ncbi:MAG: ABC transporter permease [Bacillota bacterium]|nr:ABC transporter permease [Bacillota bacterium]
MGLFKYFIKRLLLAVPTIIGVSIIVFLLIHIIPGDPVQVMLGNKATEAARTALTERLGLNQPLYTQYWNWFTHSLQGDFGISVTSYEPVMSEVMSRFTATIELAFISIIIAIVLGIIFGVTAARYRNQPADHILIGFSLLGVSIPVFWLGIMLIFLFAAVLQWLPVSGRLTMGLSIPHITGLYLVDSLLTGNMRAFADSLQHLILPAISLATIPLAIIVRVTRSSMLDVLHEDYIRTARAKGVPRRRVIFKHALKNAMIPVLTVIGLQLGTLLGGAILTETVFAWPGVGRLLVTAISNRDYPTVQGIVFLISVLFVAINIIVDCCYAYLDPRIRFEE